MDSPKDRPDLIVISYDTEDATGYSGFFVGRLCENGTIEVLEVKAGKIDRRELLTHCVDAIRRLQPKTAKIACGDREPLVVSEATVAAIIAGTVNVDDLFIGK